MIPMPVNPVRQGGAALLLLVATLFLAGVLGLSRFQGKFWTGNTTALGPSSSALTLAREALIGFAATYDYRHPGQVFAYLPCPDSNNDGVADTPCGNQDEISIGHLPWKTLGLPNLQDSAGECLWYAVGRFKDNPKSDTLNWDTQGQFVIMGSAGTTPLTAPEDQQGGAAAIIVAPGLPLSNQKRHGQAGPCPGGSAATPADYLEGSYSVAAATTLTLQQGSPSSRDNNDLLTWISPRDIFVRIKQRSDFPGRFNPMLIPSIMAGIKKELDKAPTLPPPAPASDGLATRLPASFLLPAQAEEEFRRRWDDQFRYITCSGENCLSVNGKPCQGVLIFTGERAGGGPRTQAQRGSAASYLDAENLVAAAGTLAFTGLAAYDKSRPDKDVALCLKEEPSLSFATDLDQATAISNRLSSANPTLLIDTARHSVTLGTSSVPASASPGLRYGCLWFDQVVRLGQGVRVFFDYKVEDRGDGFTFTIADADRNPDTAMCGAGAQHLGYSGLPESPASTSRRPIAPPKIALELDFRKDSGYDESSADHAYGRHDEYFSTPHLAFVYWGYRLSPPPSDPRWDDNTHGFGSGNADAPINPGFASTGGVTRSGLSTIGSRVRVRLELEREYDSERGIGIYSLKSWAFPTSHGCFIEVSAMEDLTTPFTPGQSACATPTIWHTVTLDDFAGSESLRNVRLGFTTGFGSSGQKILLQNFKARFIP